MKIEEIEKISRIANSHSRALRALGKTLDYTRDEVIDEALAFLKEGKEVFLMGVKNTSAISYINVEKLQKKGFLFHTLDNIDERGRAIYTNVVNPLTARPMTGSSATSCLHLMQDINQIAICTDGGGSILAPAIACSLYSIMGKGLGLVGEGNNISTDKINFQTGIGIIGQKYEVCEKAISALSATEENKGVYQPLNKKKIGIIQWMGENEEWIREIKEALPTYYFQLFKVEKTSDRRKLLKVYRKINEEVKIIISKEGPIDTNGLGDSIIASFGKTGNSLREKGNKYFLKIANMANSTAISIPSRELATGYLIMAKEGINTGLLAIEIGKELAEKLKRPQLFEDYFFCRQVEKKFLR